MFDPFPKNKRVIRTFRVQNLSTLGTLCRHLLVHTLDNLGWGVDITDLITQALDTPVSCRTVDGLHNVGVQVCTLSKSSIQSHLTNLGTHRCLGQLCNREFGILNSIRGFVRVDHAEVQDTI